MYKTGFPYNQIGWGEVHKVTLLLQQLLTLHINS